MKIRNQKSEIRNDSETAGNIEIRENEKPKEELAEKDFEVTEAENTGKVIAAENEESEAGELLARGSFLASGKII